MSSALFHAIKSEQINELVGALDKLSVSPEELAAIDKLAVDGGPNL